MGTHVSFISRGYNPYIGGLKPSFFMILGSKGITTMVRQPTPLTRNKGCLIAGLKGNQWVFINPDHKALFLGRVVR